MRNEEVNRMVGLKLKFFRDAKKMTQKDFCKTISLKPSHYSLLEKGRRSLPMYALKMLTEVYFLNVNWLLSFSDKMLDSSARKTLSPAEENQKLKELLLENGIDF